MENIIAASKIVTIIIVAKTNSHLLDRQMQFMHFFFKTTITYQMCRMLLGHSYYFMCVLASCVIDMTKK